ncbi:hypothetical protein MOD33_06090 [Bacillus spizizenii]|nr:hypothetical protein [Bacillus spizizenii]
MYLRFGFSEYKRNNYEHVFDLLGISDPDFKAIIANEQVLEQLHIFPSAAYLNSSPSI